MYVKIVDYSSEKAKDDFCRSLYDTGFAVLKNHTIDVQLIKEVYSSWENFFTQDEAYKNRYMFNVETQDGFFPRSISEIAKNNDVKDLKEFYHYYLWGQCPQNLRAVSKELFNALLEMGLVLLQWIEDFLPQEVKSGFEFSLDQMVRDSDLNVMRILHYPPLTDFQELSDMEEAKAVRAAAHEDINFITLLPAATAQGLEVQDNKGDWYSVECDFGYVVVNTGDMLSLLTKNYMKATTHRVINPTLREEFSKSRYSIPFFIHPRGEVELAENYTAKQFLHDRLTELGLKK